MKYTEIEKIQYEVLVAGRVIGAYETYKEAEKRLYEVKNSFLAIVHP